LSALVARGQLRPHVGAVYPLADIAAAHVRLESANNGLRGATTPQHKSKLTAPYLKILFFGAV